MPDKKRTGLVGTQDFANLELLHANGPLFFASRRFQRRLINEEGQGPKYSDKLFLALLEGSTFLGGAPNVAF